MHRFVVSRSAALVALAALTTTAAFAQADPKPIAAPAAAAPVTLKFAPKSGQTIRYQNIITVTGDGLGGGEIQQIVTTRETVTGVKEDGTSTTEATVEQMAIVFNGQEIDTGGIQLPVTVVGRDKNGAVLSYTLKGSAPAGSDPRVQEAMVRLSSLTPPAKPLVPGDTWKTTVKNTMVAGKEVAVTLTYVGREVVGGTPLDRVRFVWSMETPNGGAPIKGDVVQYLEPETGRRIKMTGTVENLPNEQAGPLKIALNETLAPAPKAADSTPKPKP